MKNGEILYLVKLRSKETKCKENDFYSISDVLEESVNEEFICSEDCISSVLSKYYVDSIKNI